MNSSGKVLILGASGGIGGEVARRLVADNWQVGFSQVAGQLSEEDVMIVTAAPRYVIPKMAYSG